MNYFRHFEQLLLPTVVLETYEGRNTLQVSVVVFWLVGLGFFILGPVPPPPFCFHTWAVSGKGIQSIHIPMGGKTQWFWMSIC